MARNKIWNHVDGLNLKELHRAIHMKIDPVSVHKEDARKAFEQQLAVSKAPQWEKNVERWAYHHPKTVQVAKTTLRVNSFAATFMFIITVIFFIGLMLFLAHVESHY